MSRIEEIKARLEKLPKNLAIRDVRIPMKIKDPLTGQMVICPRGRMMQTRQDIVDAEDRFQIPYLHFHKYPEHPAYAGENWRDFAEMFLNAKSDLEYLINIVEQLEGKQNGRNTTT